MWKSDACNYIQLFQPLSLQCTCSTPRSKVVDHAHCSTPDVAALALQSPKAQYAQTPICNALFSNLSSWLETRNIPKHDQYLRLTGTCIYIHHDSHSEPRTNVIGNNYVLGRLTLSRGHVCAYVSHLTWPSQRHVTSRLTVQNVLLWCGYDKDNSPKVLSSHWSARDNHAG